LAVTLQPRHFLRIFMTATGTCVYRKSDGKVCGIPTNKSFGFGVNAVYFYCDEHKDALFTQVTGKEPKKK
jgi:hypothetical protein